MSNETKIEKKEAKAAKKEAKAEKSTEKAAAKAEKKHAAAYNKFVKATEKKNAKGEAKAQKSGKSFAPVVIPPIDEFSTKAELSAEKARHNAYIKYVKKIEKDNLKTEKKCAKKGKPFVPVAVPAEDEFVYSGRSKSKNIVLIIILLLLIWFLIYFMIMWINYVAPTIAAEDTTTTTSSSDSGPIDTYSNPHEITTTPDYSVSDAQRLLKQTLHDNWKVAGYSSDPSGSSIAYTNNIVSVNGGDCYVFSCSGKTFAVNIKLAAVYYSHDGEYEPLSFNDTNILFD